MKSIDKAIFIDSSLIRQRIRAVFATREFVHQKPNGEVLADGAAYDEISRRH